jgi:phosphate transport system substrate-binding protein
MRLLPVLIPLLAAFAGLVGTVVAGLRFLRPGRIPRPRRLVHYRVHYDDSLGTRADVKGVAELVVRRHGQDVPDASLVMIRISNEGGLAIGKEHWVMPINFTFDGRDVVGVEVSDADGLPADLLSGDQERARHTPVPDGRGSAGGGGLALAEGETIRISKGRKSLELPRIDLRRKDRIRLLVLLSGPRSHLGPGVQGDADIKGSLKGGGLVREPTPGRERFYAFGWTGFTVLSLAGAVLAAFIVRPFSASPPPSYCVPGHIAVAGSTAFAPAVTAVAGQFTGACQSSFVSVNGPGAVLGSLGAASALQREGAGSASIRATRLVMSDGMVPDSAYPGLVPHPIAIVIFAVVVNRATGIHSLTQPQLVGIWTGKYTNWSQLNGADLPIDIVSRTGASGTRATFDRKILGTPGELGPSSSDCTSRDLRPDLPVIRCAKTSTGMLLKAVNSIGGAIGYAEAAEAAQYANIDEIQLTGQNASGPAVESGGYPFYATEYLYTDGAPASGSLLSAFLGYLYTDAAKSTLQSPSWNDIPCSLTTLCGS